MSVLVFANGEFEGGSWVNAYFEQATAVIAADGGTRNVVASGHKPDVIIGDLDSLNRSTKEEIKYSGTTVHIHPQDKDQTDLELALIYAADEIDAGAAAPPMYIFSALGGRIDQALANIGLLSHPRLAGKDVRLVEEFQQAWLVQGTTSIEGRPGDLVSLLPLGDGVVIGNTQGLQWPLADAPLRYGEALGISNRLTAETAVVTVAQGRVLCVHIRQEWER